ncbi:uncharacterized protein apold1b isoform X3 [Takifugu flavidus]|uniref:uncharacterized protein apold1b isoform X3 n=1 Tax=Takifugu flavidus TaxID=433684 RepID=UPI002544A4BF|nr:uncharacterized protein apold1b isoform X3 [Takifugu flavidus]
MNIFRRERNSTAPTPVLPPRPTKEELEHPIMHSQTPKDAGVTLGSGEEASDPATTRKSLMDAMQKVNPFKSSTQASTTVSKAPSSESLERGCDSRGSDSSQNPGMFKGVMQKVNPFRSASQQVSKSQSSESLEQGGVSNSNQKPGMLKGVMQKVNPFKSTSQVPKSDSKDDALELEKDAETKQAPNIDSQTEMSKEPQVTQRPGMIAGMIQKVNPFKPSQPKNADTQSVDSELSSSSGSLADNNNQPEKQLARIAGSKEALLIQMPSEQCQIDAVVKPAGKTQGEKAVDSSSSESLEDAAIERYTIWYSESETSHEVKSQPVEAVKKRKTFRIKRILPSAFFGSGTKDSSAASCNPLQEAIEVQTLELADVPVPGEGTTVDPLDDEDGLLAWWRTVDGWDEWNDASGNDDTEEVVEQAADRIYMAARLFVRFFNQRGGTLQQRILELLQLADAADSFHKKTVTASVGGGVASVAGSITTITGLILAPFTAGTSLIVTAVGIGVATAGGLTSASANITDTVHSKTDRKKVETMIQGYQEEIKDIKECLDFLQEGMEMLAEWDFDKFSDSIAKKHLNQNVKHVMKEGGRAGKALVINTESLIGTIQVLNVAGGAAKAAQVMSVTTGVMSGLFLALDVFFLAKDSMELKKGAKTEFALKIREVCKELQDGLLELNRIKEQLQKTMDGIEVEVEEEEEDEEMLKSDLKKLIELEE